MKWLNEMLTQRCYGWTVKIRICLKWIRSDELVTVFSGFKQINEPNWSEMKWNWMKWSFASFPHFAIHFNFTLQPTFISFIYLFRFFISSMCSLLLFSFWKMKIKYFSLHMKKREAKKKHENFYKYKCMTNEIPHWTMNWSCCCCCCCRSVYVYGLSSWKTVHFICLGNEFQSFYEFNSFLCRTATAACINVNLIRKANKNGICAGKKPNFRLKTQAIKYVFLMELLKKRRVNVSRVHLDIKMIKMDLAFLKFLVNQEIGANEIVAVLKWCGKLFVKIEFSTVSLTLFLLLLLLCTIVRFVDPVEINRNLKWLLPK